jgi:hypothetical protein
MANPGTIRTIRVIAKRVKRVSITYAVSIRHL